MIGLKTEIDYLDFSPGLVIENANAIDISIIIERAIIEGSGGPENVAITEAGLRFVRLLLSSLPVGSLPNFRNGQAIKILAQLFIHRCGSATTALKSMQTVMCDLDNESMVGNNICQT